MTKLRSRLRALVGDRIAARIRRVRLAARTAFERVVFGGELRERLLVALLASHYRSRYRRDWVYTTHPPHFWYHRMGWFRIGFGQDDIGASGYSRAFFSAEVIRANDLVLDIGCGDGFITQRFLAERAGRVHAVDIEPSAIETARRLNSRANIEYFEFDATARPFPADAYDAIVWDGAIGHFDPTTTSSMLAKIRGTLKPDGLFVGSESLGHEGSDHLQFWNSLEDMRAMLEAHFPYVELKELAMKVGTPGNEFVRREAYWRCGLAPDRLRGLDWVGS